MIAARYCDVEVQAALYYASLGWYVFPLVPGTKRPLCEHGYHDATTDETQIRAWWGAEPRAGIGIACAQSGLLVLDVDPRHGGNETLASLEARLGPLPETVEGSTGGDGRHLAFVAPDGLLRARASLGDGLDIKLNGYIVAPPSLHPSGRRYTWAREPGQPAELLPAWIEACRPSEPRRPFGWALRVEHTAGSTPYGRRALDAECENVRRAVEGTRNNALNEAAFAVGQLEAGREIDPTDGLAALLDAATCCQLPETEARKTIDSGLRAGRLHPRSAPPRDAIKAAPAPIEGEPPWPSDEHQAQVEAEGEPAWAAGLVFKCRPDGSRTLDRTPGNLALLVAHSTGWAGTLGWDDLSRSPYWIGTPPELDGFEQPRGKLTDDHAVYVRQWMRRYHGTDWTKDACWEALSAASQLHRFHPVQRYLESLEWDQQPRVGDWIARYFPGTELPEMPVGGWWLVSAVARAMRPGCQVDHMLVLEGPQGAGKSTAASILGGEWFSAELGDVRDKDAAQSLAGVWIMEIPELDAIRRADATRVKTFVSLRCDHFRPSYGRAVVDRPRQCVFMATTNESKYLHDASGGRRFWPVTVQRLDADALYRDRDQVWAEALHLYHSGERWWPAGERECETLAKVVEDRFALDPWEPKLEELMATTTESWTTGRLLSQVLSVPLDKQDRAAATRVGTIMARLGYKARRTKLQGIRVSVYDPKNRGDN